jgi:hypothetical protein
MNTQVIKRWIQYGSVFVDRFLSSEQVKGTYYKITKIIKRYKNCEIEICKAGMGQESTNDSSLEMLKTIILKRMRRW